MPFGATYWGTLMGIITANMWPILQREQIRVFVLETCFRPTAYLTGGGPLLTPMRPTTIEGIDTSLGKLFFLSYHRPLLSPWVSSPLLANCEQIKSRQGISYLMVQGWRTKCEVLLFAFCGFKCWASAWQVMRERTFSRHFSIQHIHILFPFETEAIYSEQVWDGGCLTSNQC